MSRTIADRLREIADEFPGHFPDAAPMESCIGCKLEAIAKELDAKAYALSLASKTLNSGVTIGRDFLQGIADEIGGATQENTTQQVSSNLGADRE